jgi:Bardet-Biedl syndrome 9 protein
VHLSDELIVILADETVVRYMVATHTKTLMIYEDVTLKWAAQLNYVPVQIITGNFR